MGSLLDSKEVSEKCVLTEAELDISTHLEARSKKSCFLALHCELVKV
jgi:hypothetical protein